MHHLAHPSVGRKEVHFGLLQFSQPSTSHVSLLHQEAQPGVGVAALVVEHFGLLHWMQSSMPQWLALHHDLQPGLSRTHLGLSHALHSSAWHVCSSHQEAHAVAPPPLPVAVAVGGRISWPGPQPCSLRQSLHASCLHCGREPTRSVSKPVHSLWAGGGLR